MTANIEGQFVDLRPPADWREVPLAALAEVRFSSVDKLTFSSEKPVRLCNYIDVYKNDYITSDLEFKRGSATCAEIERFGLRVGDVIITKDSETPDDIGVPAVVDYAPADLVCGYHLGLLRTDTTQIDPVFLTKQLSHHRLARYFGHQANGLTRYGLPLTSVRNAPVWLPRIEEQVVIGRIARLLDAGIARTEAMIAKLKQLRSGLLHDLLTRGIDEHGQLRDPVAHPEQFQYCSIGRIPKQWDIRTCASVCQQILVGIVVKPAQYYVKDGVPTLRSANVRENYIDLNELVYISPESNRLLSKSMLRSGDLVTVRTGYPGTTSVIPESLDSANCVDLIISRPKGEIINPHFLSLWVNSQFGKDQVLKAQGGLAQQHFNVGEMNLLVVARPSINEQLAILSLVQQADALIQTEQIVRSKLSLTKVGLMSDLLTGHVRVPETIGLQEACP